MERAMTGALLISRVGPGLFFGCGFGPGRVVTLNACLTMIVAWLSVACTPDPQIPAPGGGLQEEVDTTSPRGSLDVRESEPEVVVGGVDRIGRGGSATFQGGPPVWAEGHEGLIAGLDGELYEGYLPSTIERVQSALRIRGLYDGPVHGALDAATMAALYTFQDVSYGLQACGIPTPRTRMLLERGSHT